MSAATDHREEGKEVIIKPKIIKPNSKALAWTFLFQNQGSDLQAQQHLESQPESQSDLEFTDNKDMVKGIVTKIVTTKRRINEKRPNHPVCRGQFVIQVSPGEDLFESCRLFKGRIISDKPLPRTLPKSIETPEGVLEFSKIGHGGRLRSSIRFETPLLVKKPLQELKVLKYQWLEQIPRSLSFRMRKNFRKAFHSFDERYAYIYNNIQHESAQTVTDMLSLTRLPFSSYHKIYTRFYDKPRAGLVFLNIIIDFFGPSGQACLDDWVEHGKFQDIMKTNLLAKKGRIIDKFLRVHSILKDILEERFYTYFSFVCLYIYLCVCHLCLLEQGVT